MDIRYRGYGVILARRVIPAEAGGPVIPLYKLMRRGDACVAPTACLIVCVKMNHRILVGTEAGIDLSQRIPET